MGKTCTRCKADKPLEDFQLRKKSEPDGPRQAWCRRCAATKMRERKLAINPDLQTRKLRSRLVTAETQPCERCGVIKSVSLFPEQTCQNGQPQKICQKCRDVANAKRREEISAGKRKVGDGMAYHHPVVNGRKQCRECEEWKDLKTGFPFRKDSVDGYFHVCLACKHSQMIKYHHEVFNAVIRNNRANNEQIRRGYLHRNDIYVRVILKRHLTRIVEGVDCTGQELRNWLEHRFEGDISWDTYGVGAGKVWTIDHVIPLHLFDLKLAEEREVAFNWVNIQPGRDNFRKHVAFRVPEIEAALLCAQRYLLDNKHRDSISIIPKMLAWLEDKFDIGHVKRQVEMMIV